VSPYRINLDGVNAATPGSYTVLPDGWYDVRVIAAQETVSSQKQTPGIELTLRVISDNALGSTFKDTIWLSASPTSLGFLRQKLEAMGYPVPAGEFTLNEQELVGRVVAVETKQRQGEKHVFMDVVAYDRSTSSSGPSMPVGPPPAAPTEDWRVDPPVAPPVYQPQAPAADPQTRF
jgi:hypothetical protein